MSAPDLGSARPWEPKAGAPGPTAEEIEEQRALAMEAQMYAQRRWELSQAIRRFALVMLLTFLGGMIGGLFSALTLMWYFN